MARRFELKTGNKSDAGLEGREGVDVCVCVFLILAKKKRLS